VTQGTSCLSLAFVLKKGVKKYCKKKNRFVGRVTVTYGPEEEGQQGQLGDCRVQDQGQVAANSPERCANPTTAQGWPRHCLPGERDHMGSSRLHGGGGRGAAALRRGGAHRCTARGRCPRRHAGSLSGRVPSSTRMLSTHRCARTLPCKAIAVGPHNPIGPREPHLRLSCYELVSPRIRRSATLCTTLC